MTYAERVRVAVADPDWQKVRLSMKGISTDEKIKTLEMYYDDHTRLSVSDEEFELVKIRIDNYIKALCRGGQLFAGMTLNTMLTNRWNPIINK